MKIKLKTLAIATSLCSVLVLAPLSFAGSDSSSYHRGHDKGYHQMTERKLAKLTRRLDLSEQQQNEIKKLNSENKAEMDALKPVMDDFREQMSILMSAERFDEQAFIELRVNNQATFTSMALARAKNKFAIKSVLTETQLATYNTMKKKRSAIK